MNTDIADFKEGETFTQAIKIPHDRIAVLIGKKGETKEELETSLNCRIEVDSKEGDVQLVADESIDLMVAKDVVKAVARGFNPDIAKQLISDEFFLELVNLNDYNKHKNHHQRLKGRVIAREGRSRNLIEEYIITTLFEVSIPGYVPVKGVPHQAQYGKTLMAVGDMRNCEVPVHNADFPITGSIIREQS